MNTHRRHPTPSWSREPGCIPGWRTLSAGERLKQTQQSAAAAIAKFGEDKKPRKAPEFYAGERYNEHVVQFNDVERRPNGTIPSKRSKIMRRLIRGALKAKFSRLTSSLRLARGLKAQAFSLAREEKRSSRWGLRLLAKELTIHRTVYAPTGPELRAMRTLKRARARKGVVQDTIMAIVDRMTGERGQP